MKKEKKQEETKVEEREEKRRRYRVVGKDDESVKTEDFGKISLM